ncbi:transposase, partial [Paenibacillus zanthoxyli]|uniref:transposase n=1 Tax=Paenibacillus zanthoxyli TaxID=369399 RepID=UPI0004721BD1
TSVVETYKGLLLSMDGVQPEKGNETLYVVREGFSGRILAAKNLKSGSKTELMALLKRPLKDLGLPVIGLVSDGQKSIRLAMEETWPDTPYQYCQYHYLKDIAKPVVDLDRKLKTGLKKSLRGLREIEKQVQDDDSVEGEVTRDYLAAT